MANKPERISELDEKTILESGDLLVIVDLKEPDIKKRTKRIKAENAGIVDGELRLTPKTSSSGPEGTLFYDSVDKCIYVGVE